jgi:hypothetical protein
MTILGTAIRTSSSPVAAYETLRDKVLVVAPDAGLVREDETAATYGLVLSAAVAADDQATARRATDWLMGDVRPGGWGTSWTWDPFGDGSVTWSGTPYAGATAMAINGLLDQGVDAATVRPLADMLIRWAREGWSDGYYWYSFAPQDAIDTPSVSAMLAGVTARFVDAHGDVLLPAERELLETRVRDSFAHLGTGDAGPLFWKYSADQDIVNDLSHHGYILWGAEQAREAGFSIQWTREEALASINRYDLVYPLELPMTPAMSRRYDSPWVVSGTGTALLLTAMWHADSAGWVRKACVALEQAPIVPRFAAHTLLGFALLGMCDCPTGRPDPPASPPTC